MVLQLTSKHCALNCYVLLCDGEIADAEAANTFMVDDAIALIERWFDRRRSWHRRRSELPVVAWKAAQRRQSPPVAHGATGTGADAARRRQWWLQPPGEIARRYLFSLHSIAELLREH